MNKIIGYSGVTVHVVDEGIDTGLILGQARVPIFEDDTLDTFETRIHQAEYVLYPMVINAILKGPE